ncbi:MAG: GAF and ANTAR domain-containing protein [Actinomycetota bacterium]|nr:GAF and ANTAR domain-containing protein [Actinomycetota bacterium]
MAKLEISPEILDALQTLSSLLESEDAFERTLDTIVDLSCSTLPGCDAAGITVRIDGKDTTAASSDSYTLEIDKIQYDSGQGPCVEALETGAPQFIDAISDEIRWPEFRERAASQGLRSSASFPLRMNGSVGALNLYAREEHAFDEASRRIAEIFARQSSIALENAHIYAAARRLGDQLNEALQTRDLIGQAKGILMEREGISDPEAFEMLRTISQNSNVKLRDIAHRLVEDKPPTSA